MPPRRLFETSPAHLVGAAIPLVALALVRLGTSEPVKAPVPVPQPVVVKTHEHVVKRGELPKPPPPPLPCNAGGPCVAITA